MKRSVFFLLLICAITGLTYAQSSPAIELATRIADKMRDSLQLSDVQHRQVYAVNLALHQQKHNVRNKWQNRDSVRLALQRVENTRDSLYKTTLSAQQFELYRQKKRLLISAN